MNLGVMNQSSISCIIYSNKGKFDLSYSYLLLVGQYNDVCVSNSVAKLKGITAKHKTVIEVLSKA